MIDTLQIQGFQSHDSTEIELDKGVNVIVGSTDSGKSSIIRACKWLFQNRPQGDSFRNNLLKDKDECYVCAIFDGDYVHRQKMKGTNSYLVGDKEFKALRSDVPQDVQDVTLMKEVNLQSQHPSDQYFLLTDSPGQVAKKFNEVAGLQIMDKAMFKINGFVRECKSKSKVYDTEIADKKAELKTLDWVPKAQKEAKELAKFSNEISTLVEDLNNIDDVLFNIANNEDELGDYGGLDDSFSGFKELQSMGLKHSAKSNATVQLKNLILDVKKADKHLKIYSAIRSASTSLKSLDSCADSFRTLSLQFDKTKEILKELKWIDIDIKDATENVEFYGEKFTIKLQTGACPVCERRPR